MFKKLGVSIFLLCISLSAFAQSQVLRAESSAGVYQNVKTDGNQNLSVSMASPGSTGDPCIASSVAKLSAIINITTATTTQLVALSGTTVVYVCDFTLTISQVVTTPNTLKFVRGTGASCGTGTTDLTGLFGDGGVTAAPPLFIASSSTGTTFKTTAGNALCATTAIGATGSFQGVITYVQQ